MERRWIRCGKEHVEWDFVVVWVTPRATPYASPTKLLFHFPFGLPNNVSLAKSARLIEQWTYVRGTCERAFGEHEPEFVRAKRMACRVVATYRRHHLKRHGTPPHSATLTAGVQYQRPTLS